MVFYPDLSPYAYTDWPSPLLNVGWLAASEEFPIGQPDVELRDRLLVLARNPVRVARGWHDCDFCDVESPIEYFPVAGTRRFEVYLGNAELEVVGDHGVVYTAPTLIAHYVGTHGYRPPGEFRAAVMRQA